jgi:hypothetical protein
MQTVSVAFGESTQVPGRAASAEAPANSSMAVALAIPIKCIDE